MSEDAFLRELRFHSCFVTVAVTDFGGRERVQVSAGATMTPEEALDLAKAILEARRSLVGEKEPVAWIRGNPIYD